MAQLKVYYDGLCVLCSREIEVYRRRDLDQRVDWIDISLPGFDASKEGLDPVLVNRFFHVRRADGQVIAGVDAFVEIWKTIPSLRLMAKAADLPGARAAMRAGYAIFARVRPYLPRRSRPECDNGACEARLSGAR